MLAIQQNTHTERRRGPSQADIREEKVLYGKTDTDRGRERERRNRIKKKKNKWAPPDVISSTGLHAIPFLLPGGLSMEQQEALLLRCRLEEISKKLNMRELEFDTSEDRSPSPEPIYDDKGKRINTREQRAKDKIQEELNKLVDVAFLFEPKFKPPPYYDPTAVKKMRKIFIPQDKYPDYNFIGLIIGPRGNTQKRMEKETGCKISIRGKGSVKDGKNKKPSPGDDEELHVLVMGTTDSQVNAAAKMIKELLVPIDEDKNEHKRQQLRELAEINGTLVNRTWTGTGGAASDLSYRRTDISCAICGDKSHPTLDCPLRGGAVGGMNGAAVKSHIEQQYDAFLYSIHEIPGQSNQPPPFIGSSSYGEAPPPPPNDVYAEFQSAISSVTKTESKPSYNAVPWTQQQNQQAGNNWNQTQYNYGSVPPPQASYYNQ